MSIFQDFFAQTSYISQHQHTYHKERLGGNVTIIRDEADMQGVDVIIIGIGEQRGAGKVATSHAPDDVRAALYELYFWHEEIKVGDAGNLILGNNLYDSYQALVTTLYELKKSGKKVIILGGSHDLTFAQYKAYAKSQQLANGLIVDSKINIADEEQISDQGFLYNIISDANNYLSHLSVLGFQSYMVSPIHLQTLDKLRFDCHRLGELVNDIEYYEPEFRLADFVSIDIQALRAPDMPSMTGLSPNGLTAAQLCQLANYAGLSQQVDTIGIYGLDNTNDTHHTGAKVVAQVIWYYLNGLYLHVREADFDSYQEMETHIVATDAGDLTFKKSLKTQLWWIQAINGKWIPISHQDYLQADNHHIPERWLRYNERNV